jgi:unsaturated rhamnogalacturonyl hydrolase
MADDLDDLRRAARPLLDLPYEAWHFGDSVAFEAMIAATDVLGDDRYLSFAHGFARGWAASRAEFEPFDLTAAGAAMCEIVARTGDELLRSRLIALAEYLAARPRLGGVFQTFPAAPLRVGFRTEPIAPWERALLDDPGPGVFVDCLHFDPPFFVALAAVTGSAEWKRLAIEQALGYVDLLHDPASGLFHHFFLERTGRAHILGWGRGQGWALLGLLEVIEHLPACDERERLAVTSRATIEAMLQLQRPDGHWDAVVQRPEGGIETSTAAFMAVAFGRAAGLRVVPHALVAGSIDAARAATRASVDDSDRLQGVSAAVWASTSLTHYDRVARGFVVPWGQGPLVLALAAAVREGVPT